MRNPQYTCQRQVLDNRAPLQKTGSEEGSVGVIWPFYSPRTSINTDKNPAYNQAIRELKQDGSLSQRVEHHQIKDRNNRLEADHGKLKRLIKPARGFQSMKTAYATIKGFEVMRMFKKGQFNIWMYGNRNEVSFINQLFHLYG